jgi:hypothetical protein
MLDKNSGGKMGLILVEKKADNLAGLKDVQLDYLTAVLKVAYLVVERDAKKGSMLAARWVDLSVPKLDQWKAEWTDTM